MVQVSSNTIFGRSCVGSCGGNNNRATCRIDADFCASSDGYASKGSRRQAQPKIFRKVARLAHSVRFWTTAVRWHSLPRLLSGAFSIAVSFLSLGALHAADWPQFLGPSRNSVYAGTDLAKSWSKEGPPVLWQKSVGQGFSGPAVSRGKLILFHRLENEEIVECLEGTTGKSVWKFGYPTAYRDDFGFDEGPRATPSISNGKVYTHGAEGMITCVDFETGRKLWSVDTRKDFRSAKGFFGIACSPLIEGQAVLLNIGGSDGAGIIGFDKDTGKVLWKATDDEASYSSPVAAKFGERRFALFLTKANLRVVDPASGKIAFTFPFRPSIRASVTAATPLVVDDFIFISASYGAGSALLELKETGLQKIWAAADALSNHYATSVYHGGFLYGIHGRTDPGFEPSASLHCVEFKTGKVRWEKDGFGAATITLAGDELLILTERGELIRAPASPDGYKPAAQAQVLPNQVRAHPALADGLLFARSKDKLFCLDLRDAGK